MSGTLLKDCCWSSVVDNTCIRVGRATVVCDKCGTDVTVAAVTFFAAKKEEAKLMKKFNKEKDESLRNK